MAAALAAPVLAVALAGCGGEPRGAAFQPSPAAAAIQRPELGETAPLRQAFAEAAPAARRLVAGAEALEARTEALRGRAAALDGPVVDPARRDRMLAAASGR